MILVTGGAGYIGSHTVLELLNFGYEVLVLDSLENASHESLKRVEQITGKKLTFLQGDVRDELLLERIFDEYSIFSVLHFAGYKSVGESVKNPLKYYDNNFKGTLTLLTVMEKYSVRNLVFSSSATIYGSTSDVPIMEDSPIGKTANPYGTSKYIVERMLAELSISNDSWSIFSLRYFNPVGAHSSGMIGEDPKGTPNNLLPYISQVAIGRMPHLSIFGRDYPTKDGTGVRDYIHVVDLALGHIAALQKIESVKGFETINLGTGNGYSVLEVIDMFEEVTGKRVPYEVVARRPGDSAISFACSKNAEVKLQWKAKYNLRDMIRDTWNWQIKNPNGYSN
ncbi:UDP-glucose 4-epimerase GalE [Idiomarina sp. HB]|uniref:UDP-glucose 4-epimerase GalE n=1 Tax=Idiomarina sp. HB TaxID=3110479 RepID=UPI003A7F6562